VKTTVKNPGIRIKKKEMLREQLRQENPEEAARIATIQALIPLGLNAVKEKLQAEVLRLAGPRYHNRDHENGRHGSNVGSVYVYDQKVKTLVPRVRNKETGEEMSLMSYAAFQEPTTIDTLTLSRMMQGVSTGNYQETALQVAETMGIERNSVSRRWIRSSAKKLQALQERDLSVYDIIAIFIDGKAFSREKEMVVAAGVTIEGEKVMLGFVETSSENHRVIRQFFQGLKSRGLRVENDILFVMDGSKGIRKGVEDEFPETAFVQRCTWHKREDILSYLSETDKEYFRPKLQDAYEMSSYTEAKDALKKIRTELSRVNLSAVNSLDEGFEETLTLQKLGVFEQLGTSFKTTNVIENINKLIEMKTSRVCYWKNSDQRQRWLGTALWAVEPKLRKVKGYRYLPMLRSAMQRFKQKNQQTELLKAA
jgi:transposase-like protein